MRLLEGGGVLGWVWPEAARKGSLPGPYGCGGRWLRSAVVVASVQQLYVLFHLSHANCVYYSDDAASLNPSSAP